jgi:hypothetical protein
MDAMLKISIVMLTTAFFAVLLIADPYGSQSFLAIHQTIAPITQVASAPAQPGPILAMNTQPVAAPEIATTPEISIAPQDTKLVAMGDTVAMADTEAGAPAMLPTRVAQQRPDRRVRVVQYRLRRHG